MPKLLLKFNGAVIREVAVDKPEVTVGRKTANDVVIDNPAISGRHCRFLLSGGVVSVEDLDSTNGTFVNDKRVLKANLKNNDVVVLAKHTFLFVDDVPAPAPEDAPTEPSQRPPDETTKIETGKLDEMRKNAARSAENAGKSAALRVLKGGENASEYELRGLSTYIGRAERAQVRIKGSGFFSNAPDVAAYIHRRPEGYVLVALESGYPKVNGAAVTGQVQLKDGDILECGGTTLQFFLKT